MNEAIHTEEYKGYTINIYPDHDYQQDEEFTNPEPFHTYGKWNNYSLFETEGSGDDFLQHINDLYNVLPQHVEDYYQCPTRSIKDQEDAEASVQKWIDRHMLILPLYIYEHGGITMSTGSFSCMWDSGQAGYIYMSKKEAKEQYKSYEKAYEAMESRVKYLDAICTGSVYGYTVEKNGEVVESCFGYVETDYPIEKTSVYTEAKSEVDYHFKKDLAKRKKDIKARTPILYRIAI